jgi:hypothetical protein
MIPSIRGFKDSRHSSNWDKSGRLGKDWQMGREIETPDLQRRWRVFGTESVNVATDVEQSAPCETTHRMDS